MGALTNERADPDTVSEKPAVSRFLLSYLTSFVSILINILKNFSYQDKLGTIDASINASFNCEFCKRLKETGSIPVTPQKKTEKLSKQFFKSSATCNKNANRTLNNDN